MKELIDKIWNMPLTDLLVLAGKIAIGMIIVYIIIMLIPHLIFRMFFKKDDF